MMLTAWNAWRCVACDSVAVSLHSGHSEMCICGMVTACGGLATPRATCMPEVVEDLRRVVYDPVAIFLGHVARRAGDPPLQVGRPGSGRRLAAILEIHPPTRFAARCWSMNLRTGPDERIDPDQAGARALAAVAEARHLAGWTVPLVLLGAQVKRAVGWREPDFTWSHATVSAPHPSGRTRVWNDPGTVEKFRFCLRSVVESLR